MPAWGCDGRLHTVLIAVIVGERDRRHSRITDDFGIVDQQAGGASALTLRACRAIRAENTWLICRRRTTIYGALWKERFTLGRLIVIRIALRCFVLSLAAGCLIAPTAVLAGAAPKKGDPASGKLLYAECEGCHALAENKIGPKHCGLVGRKAAAVPDFASYSDAMRTSGLTWDAKTLDAFLAEPFSYVSGTVMGYAGIPDQKSRIDLIAYLEQAGKDPAVCGAN